MFIVFCVISNHFKNIKPNCSHIYFTSRQGIRYIKTPKQFIVKGLLVIISISTPSLYGANSDDDENFLKILLDMRRLGATPRATKTKVILK